MEKAQRSAPATSRWGALALRWGGKNVPTDTTTESAALPELSLSSPPRRPTKKQRGNQMDTATAESRITDSPFENIVKSSSDIHSLKLNTMQHGHRQELELEQSKQPPNETTGSNVSKCTAPSGQLDYPIGTAVQKFFFNDTGYAQLYQGRIEAYDSEERLYLIRYEDDDAEDITESQLTELLVTKSTRGVPRVSRDWQSCRGDPPTHHNSSHAACLFALHGILPQLAIQRIRGFKKNCRQQVATFFLFMSERQRVWVRRQRGDAAPWSVSHALQHNHWCNNYRELDRGTAWFHAHVLDLHDRCRTKLQSYNDHYVRRVLFAAYVYRQINRIETFRKSGFPDENNVEPFFKELEKIRIGGDAVFTAAHQTTSLGELKGRIGKVVKKDKTKQSPLDKVCDEIRQADNDKEWIVKALRKLPGIGSFTAWQILCDMHESKCFTVADHDDYCELGPGAKHGLGIIFPNETPSLTLAQKLVQEHKQVYRALGVDFPYWRGRPLTIKEIEHALCEFAKFSSSRTHSNGRRAFRLRTPLDEEKTCFQCEVVCHGGMTSCDTCRLCCCFGCSSQPQEPQDKDDNDDVSWICHRCQLLECFHVASSYSQQPISAKIKRLYS